MKRLALVAALLAAAPAPVLAKSDKTVAYPAAKVFPTVVRFLRVDDALRLSDEQRDHVVGCPLGREEAVP